MNSVFIDVYELNNKSYRVQFSVDLTDCLTEGDIEEAILKELEKHVTVEVLDYRYKMRGEKDMNNYVVFIRRGLKETLESVNIKADSKRAARKQVKDKFFSEHNIAGLAKFKYIFSVFDGVIETLSVNSGDYESEI